MTNSVNQDDPAPANIPAFPARRWVCWLSLLGAVHVLVFSAAFPFFNNMDEIPHFDLVVKYAHGHFLQGLEPIGGESSQYMTAFNSPEYVNPAGPGLATPFWRQTANRQASVEAVFARAAAGWPAEKRLPSMQNYESTQPPLYYLLAGLWWRVGQGCGLAGLPLLYWLRFLNAGIVVALIWVGYAAARLIFPTRPFFQIGVPALVAFMPQQAFYSVQNDVLSPLCFGLVFICLALWLWAKVPGSGLGVATGLALAACYLTKLSNLPLLAVAALVVLLKTCSRWRAGTLRPASRALVWLVLCAGLPVGAWLAWSKYAFGDFTGSALKLRAITWTLKPFHEWWHHPIFSADGLWTFVSALLVAFWQGEFRWHGLPLDLPVIDAFYVIPTLCLLIVGAASLWRQPNPLNVFQRRMLVLSLGCFAAGVVFLAWMSIIYDFGICINPSRGFPYFIAGRLILGALVPFLLVLLQGLDYLLRGAKNHWLRPAALGGLILFMLVSEIVTDWPVFASQYNLYHW
ncbi:MAG: DUF2142 domain-containing protein [Verrucomicrobiota bacterium]|jgi:hypothetical protein